MHFTKHITTFLFLLPFVSMLVSQDLLNYDDNLMVLPKPGKRDGQYYNLVMAVVLWFGVIAYFIHMVHLARESRRWLAAKVIFLISLFVGLFSLAS